MIEGERHSVDPVLKTDGIGSMPEGREDTPPHSQEKQKGASASPLGWDPDEPGANLSNNRHRCGG